MKSHLSALACTWLIACGQAIAQAPTAAPADADPAHAALRTLKTELIDAVKSGDIDRVLTSVHPNVVVTWQNNVVCRGRDELRDFFHRMGKDAFKGYKTPPTPDGLTILHGNNTGVTIGETVAQYHLLGATYDMKSRWTATLVKQDDRWMLAGYHLSMNVLDNPLLSAAKGSLYGVAGTAAVAGLLIGLFIGRKTRA